MQAVGQIWSGGVPWGFGTVKWLWKKNKPLTVGVVVIVAVIKIRKAIQRRQRRIKWANAGRDIVILHGLGKGLYTPSVSPFVMKLSTYLRMAQIEHQVDFSEPFGPKGKSPWITINGESIGDSQLVMDFLKDHFEKDLSRHLSEDQKAVAWTFSIMMDEHLCWALKDWRWVLDWGRGIAEGINMPHIPIFTQLFFYKGRRLNIQGMYAQGMGRHTHQEIKQLAIRDLAAASKFLGSKPFLMGDEPCEADCSVFGSLVQIKYNYPGSPYTPMLDNEFANLGAYVIRMRERFWPDWDKCLDKPRGY